MTPLNLAYQLGAIQAETDFRKRAEDDLGLGPSIIKTPSRMPMQRPAAPMPAAPMVPRAAAAPRRMPGTAVPGGPIAPPVNDGMQQREIINPKAQAAYMQKIKNQPLFAPGYNQAPKPTPRAPTVKPVVKPAVNPFSKRTNSLAPTINGSGSLRS